MDNWSRFAKDPLSCACQTLMAHKSLAAVTVNIIYDDDNDNYLITSVTAPTLYSFTEKSTTWQLNSNNMCLDT